MIARPRSRAAGAIASAPCLVADRTARHCILGLLLGVACCPDGTCGLCREVLVRARREGFDEERAHRSLARSRRGLLAVCPLCGFPPPPPFLVVPPLPRLDRSDRGESNAWECRVCGTALTRGRRQYCSDRCYLVAEQDRTRG